jgi:hypothetical protein
MVIVYTVQYQTLYLVTKVTASLLIIIKYEQFFDSLNSVGMWK